MTPPSCGARSARATCPAPCSEDRTTFQAMEATLAYLLSAPPLIWQGNSVAPTLRSITIPVTATVVAGVVAERSVWGTVAKGAHCDLAAAVTGPIQAVIGRRLTLQLTACDADALPVTHSLPTPDDARRFTAQLSSAATPAPVQPGAQVGDHATVVPIGGGVHEVQVLIESGVGDYTLAVRLDGAAFSRDLVLAVSCPEGKEPLTDGHGCGCKPGSEPVDGVVGGATCEPCAAGHAKLRAGDTACETCRPGSHQPSIGALECALCDAGTYQPGDGAASCLACGVAQYSAEGATRCEQCGVGGATSGIDCGWEDHAKNAALGLAANGSEPRPGVLRGAKAGYWIDQVVTVANANATRGWQCLPAEACAGGIESECRIGHTHVICSRCESGYYREPSSGLCLRSPDGRLSAEAALPLGLLCAILFASTIGTLCTYCNHRQLRASSSLKESELPIPPWVNQQPEGRMRRET